MEEIRIEIRQFDGDEECSFCERKAEYYYGHYFFCPKHKNVLDLLEDLDLIQIK